MSLIDDLIRKGRLKPVTFATDMCAKEYEVGKRDLVSAEKSFTDGNYKWATIQAYFAIFHAVRSLVYKAGYREESHTALKLAFKGLYIGTGKLSQAVFDALERGMDLREMADYKENFSQSGAEHLIKAVKQSLLEINAIFEK